MKADRLVCGLWAVLSALAWQGVAAQSGCKLQIESAAFDEPHRAGDIVTFVIRPETERSLVFSFLDANGDGFGRWASGPDGASSAQFQISYSAAFVGQVKARAGLQGCSGTLTATRDLEILGPSMEVTAGTPIEICGDGDADVEPGEHWQVPATLANTGTEALDEGAHALFAPVDAEAAHLADLEHPTVAIPELAVGEAIDLSVDVHIRPDAACGSTLGIEYVGTAAPRQSSAEGAPIFQTDIGGASCEVANCPVVEHAAVDRRYGMFYNPRRSGNGLFNFVYPPGADEGSLGAIWFTAEGQLFGTWYIVAGPSRHGLSVADVYYYTNAAAPDGFAPTARVIGRAWVAQPEPELLVFAWDITAPQCTFGCSGPAVADVRRRSIELHGTIGLPFSSPNRSQQWYPPSQSGWGVAIESNATPSGYNEFWAVFYYDSQGFPRWSSGTDSDDAGAISMSAYPVHCPGCPYYLDWVQVPFHAPGVLGTVGRTYQSLNAATVTSLITHPALGDWRRANVPFVPFATPIQP